MKEEKAVVANVCGICGQKKRPGELLPADLLRPALIDAIKKSNPDWRPGGYICTDDVKKFRLENIRDILEKEKGELSALETEVVHSLKEQDLMSKNINSEFDSRFTFGERVADKIASFGGSWKFIGIFAGVLITWILINSAIVLWRVFDPYPFILLNLVLSCLAAIQAPIIMMSQNRQEARDRLHSDSDYRVNLKAELEIRLLNEKIDHLLLSQWTRLLDIQQTQMEQLDELARRLPPAKN
jgi:uncharacterized membrane protein